MECVILLDGGIKSPALTDQPVAQAGLDILDQPLDVDHRMPGKDIGEAVGEVAGQATARPLPQVQVKLQLPALLVETGKTQGNVIRPFAGVTKQGFKESIGPLWGKQCLDRIGTEDARVICHDL